MSDRPTDPSQWPWRKPARSHQTPIEPDPTGVREILASLRDPGPMPPHLVRRISASLSAEQARREQARGEESRGEESQLLGAGSSESRTPEPSALESGTLESSTPEARTVQSGAVHSFAAAHERRASTNRRWPLIAAAASVAVLAGAVVMGILAVLNGGTITTASHDSASMTAAGGSDEGAAERSAQDGGGAEPTTEEGADAAAPLEDAATLVAPVPVLSTGAVLTRATLAEHVRTVADREDWVPDAVSEQLASDSPINTSHGAVDCLNSALPDAPPDLVGRIDAIDFVRYDGEPAGLILVLEEPGGPARPLTAYVVPADCGHSTPRLLDDPLPLAS